MEGLIVVVISVIGLAVRSKKHDGVRHATPYCTIYTCRQSKDKTVEETDRQEKPWTHYALTDYTALP